MQKEGNNKKKEDEDRRGGERGGGKHGSDPLEERQTNVSPWRPEELSAGQCNPGFLLETALYNSLFRCCAIHRVLPSFTF